MRCAPFCNNNSATSKLLCRHARAKGDRLNWGEKTFEKHKEKRTFKEFEKEKEKKKIQIECELH